MANYVWLDRHSTQGERAERMMLRQRIDAYAKKITVDLTQESFEFLAKLCRHFPKNGEASRSEVINYILELLYRMPDDVAFTIIECCKNEMAYQQRIVPTAEYPFWKDKHERNIKSCERTIDVLELTLDIRNNT